MKLNELPPEIINYISQFLTEEQDWSALSKVCKRCREATVIDTYKRQHNRQFYVGKKFKFDWERYNKLMIYNIEIKGNIIEFPSLINGCMFMSGEFMIPNKNGWRKYCFFKNKNDALHFPLIQYHPIKLKTQTASVVRFECDVSDKILDARHDIYYGADAQLLEYKFNDDERCEHIRFQGGMMAVGLFSKSQDCYFVLRHFFEMNFIPPVFLNPFISNIDKFIDDFWAPGYTHNLVVHKFIIPSDYRWGKTPYPNTYLNSLSILRKNIKEGKVPEDVVEWIENKSGWFGIEKLVGDL